jgi:hypothetical protein
MNPRTLLARNEGKVSMWKSTPLFKGVGVANVDVNFAPQKWSTRDLF